METKRIRFMEHLAVAAPASLRDFCHILRREYALPAFCFDGLHSASLHVALFSLDHEQSECGFVEKDGIEYNITRYPSQPFTPEILQIRDTTVPDECNFGIALVVSNECPEEANVAWGASELVPRVAQKLANVLGQEVHHHRTSLARETIVRTQSFLPVDDA